jgi:hypothetical protein
MHLSSVLRLSCKALLHASVRCGTYDKISGSAAFAWSVLCCRDFKIEEDNYKIDSHYDP